VPRAGGVLAGGAPAGRAAARRRAGGVPADPEGAMTSWVGRMVGAAKLKVSTYEEVEADSTATVQAMGVVLLSAAAAGIGEIGYGGRGVIIGCAAALIGWLVWAFLTWLIG